MKRDLKAHVALLLLCSMALWGCSASGEESSVSREESIRETTAETQITAPEVVSAPETSATELSVTTEGDALAMYENILNRPDDYPEIWNNYSDRFSSDYGFAYAVEDLNRDGLSELLIKCGYFISDTNFEEERYTVVLPDTAKLTFYSEKGMDFVDEFYDSGIIAYCGIGNPPIFRYYNINTDEVWTYGGDDSSQDVGFYWENEKTGERYVEDAATKARDAYVTGNRITPDFTLFTPYSSTVDLDNVSADLPDIFDQPPTEAPMATEIPKTAIPVQLTPSASSILSPVQTRSAYYTYEPEKAVDGDLSTCWSEGVSGDGIGESISLPTGGDVTTITIYNGLCSDSDLFYKNNRIKEMEIRYDDGQSFTVTLDGEYDQQPCIISLSPSIQTGYITFVINSIYEGNKYDDTCISEIRFN